MPSYLITGANRGIGLGFAAELLKEPGNLVVVTTRNLSSSKALYDIKARHPGHSINKAVKEVTDLLPNGLDNLISNAGIGGDPFSSWESMDVDITMQEVAFSVKTHIQVIRSFHPLVLKSQQKRVLVISSVLGSIELASSLAVSNGYSIARAALNMAIRKWSGVMTDGVIMTLIHPGYVGETNIGSPILDFMQKNAPQVPVITVEQSAMGSMRVLKGLTHQDHGAFYNYDGTKLPF
ncbi:putative short-chain dehydrogenases/reductase [Trichoderma barbatum]